MARVGILRIFHYSFDVALQISEVSRENDSYAKSLGRPFSPGQGLVGSHKVIRVVAVPEQHRVFHGRDDCQSPDGVHNRVYIKK